MFPRPLIVAVLTALSASAAHAQSPLPVPTVGYSADRIVETEAGVFSGKVYAMPDRDRSETSMGGMTTVIVLRRDLQSGWMLMPSQKMYRELDLSEARKQSGAAPAEDMTITAIGPDIVEETSTTKYKVVMKDGSAGGFMWFTAEGIALKMDLLSKGDGRTDHVTMTLKNLQTGPQDAALFEPPTGYTKMPGFPGMKGGLPGFGRKRGTGH